MCSGYFQHCNYLFEAVINLGLKSINRSIVTYYFIKFVYPLPFPSIIIAWQTSRKLIKPPSLLALIIIEDIDGWTSLLMWINNKHMPYMVHCAYTIHVCCTYIRTSLIKIIAIPWSFELSRQFYSTQILKKKLTFNICLYFEYVVKFNNIIKSSLKMSAYHCSWSIE